jgi:3',5'-cyclic AMP phosphodiesterase CpdA
MLTLAHLSDLHFGRLDPAVAESLRKHLLSAPPDVVIVSGDFTQRARRGQFRAAAEWVKSLPGQKLVVPGNHDVPLLNVWARLVDPLGRYRRYVTSDLRPVLRAGEATILGINSAARGSWRWNGFWKDGSIRRHDVREIRLFFEKNPSELRVVVTHHPLAVDDDRYARDRARRYVEALAAFAEARVDLILYGHIHIPHAQLTEVGGRRMVLAMSGTSTSVRRRAGQANSYNRIVVDADRMTVDVMSHSAGEFVIARRACFARSPDGWQSAGERTDPSAPEPA